MPNKTFIAAIVMLLALTISGCDAAPTGPYESAAEYTITDNTGALAADSESDFYLMADAAKRHDYASVLSLEMQGKAFILKSGTRVIAGQIEPTGEICEGEVRSGEYISKQVVLACAQLK